MGRPASLALLPVANVDSLIVRIHSDYVAFLGTHTIILASPTSWGLHCKLGIIFTASSSGLLGPPYMKSDMLTFAFLVSVKVVLHGDDVSFSHQLGLQLH